MCKEKADGAPGGIRTPDQQDRNLLLYPTELLARIDLSARADRATIIRTHFAIAKTFTLRTRSGAFPYRNFEGIIPA